MKPRRVAYILKRFPRASETFISQEILELERRGLEVVVLALRPNDTPVTHDWLRSLRAPVHTYDSYGVSQAWKKLKSLAALHPQRRDGIHRTLLTAFDHPQRSGRRYLAEAVWVAERIDELRIGHLHAHFANHPTFVAMLSHFITGVAYSFTCHAKDIFSAGPPPDLWRQQVAHAAFAVTVTEANRRHLEAILGPRLAPRLRRLYNGVDLKAILPGRRPSRQLLEVLFVGRLIEKKGADLLIRAVGELPPELPMRLTVTGDGPDAQSLERLVDELGLGDRVRFLGDVPHQDVIGLMRASDLFVLPCRIAADGDRDALPTVLLEAMATGLPCISTAVNGVPEIIEHEVNGLLVPQDDSIALARAMSGLLQEATRRQAMGGAARLRAEQRFDLEINVATLHHWMQAAAESPPPSHPSRPFAASSQETYR